jgi:hypothetical protein
MDVPQRVVLYPLCAGFGAALRWLRPPAIDRFSPAASAMSSFLYLSMNLLYNRQCPAPIKSSAIVVLAARMG